MDKIAVACKCGARLFAPAEKQGRQAKCPQCGAAITIKAAPPELPVDPRHEKGDVWPGAFDLDGCAIQDHQPIRSALVRGETRRILLALVAVVAVFALLVIAGTLLALVRKGHDGPVVTALSPEEARFAEKYQAFLDYCSGTIRLLRDVKMDAVTERIGKTTDSYAALPEPITGAPWTEKALRNARALSGWIDGYPMMVVQKYSDLLRQSDGGPNYAEIHKDLERASNMLAADLEKLVTEGRALLPDQASAR